jgi:hypothetical protein
MSDIHKKLLGIALPLRFETNRLSRSDFLRDSRSGQALYSITGIPTSGVMRLYFAPKPLRQKNVERTRCRRGAAVCSVLEANIWIEARTT